MNKKILLFLFLVMTTAAPVGATVVYPFEGEINFRTQEFKVKIESESSGNITVSNTVLDEYRYSLSADFDHIKTNDLDISSQLRAIVTKSTDVDGQKVFTGEIESQYMLVDYKPVRDLSGSFFIKNSVLTMSALKFGGVNVNGSVNTEQPHDMNFALTLDRIPMERFLDIWAPNRTYDSDGLVSGVIKVSGDLNGLYMKGKLDGRNGFIKTFDFNDIHLDIEGTYPNLQIAKSKVVKKDGINFEFEGPIDLSDTVNFKKQLKELTFMPVVRSSGQEREWTIRQAKDDTTGTTSLKYLLRKDTDDVSGMLGIEKSLEF